jgi:hypothetical protein
LTEAQQLEQPRKQFRRDPVSKQRETRKAVDDRFRRDPVHRLADGAVFPKVENAHPDMAYKLVFQGTNNAEVRQHEQQGWQVVYGHPDGPRLTEGIGASAKENEPIEWHGHVLMDINKEDIQRVVDAGQARVDRIEARIIDKERGPIDAARGMRSRYAKAVNETKKNETNLVVNEEEEQDDG